GVDVFGGGRKRQVRTRTAGVLDHAIEDEVCALGALALDDGGQGLDPFAGLGRVEVLVEDVLEHVHSPGLRCRRGSGPGGGMSLFPRAWAGNREPLILPYGVLLAFDRMALRGTAVSGFARLPRFLCNGGPMPPHAGVPYDPSFAVAPAVAGRAPDARRRHRAGGRGRAADQPGLRAGGL